ncbi:integrase family protein [Salinisphaera shabanensis T35B1]|uniref:site-specific integrase n=1 Tax=Salinisphaera shabanensis TaxID=180542 RepID=UPI00333ED152
MKASVTQKTVEAAKPDAKPYEIRDTKLAGFICRVQPSGRKTYIVEYARGRRMTIGNAAVLTPAQAREKAKMILGQAAEGQDPALEKRKQKSGTLRAFIENEYRPWAKANRKQGDANCDRALKVFPALADRPLHEITAHQVDRIRTERLNAGRAPTTINRDVACLSGALSYAVRAKYIEVHPLADLKAADSDTSSKVRYLSDDEAKRLRAALRARDDEIREGRNRGNAWREERGRELMPAIPLDGYGDHLTPLVLLSLNTGVRRGEAFGLEWADVDFELQQVTIRGATSKKNRTRHIPLNTEALDALTRWHKQAGETKLVFTNRDGGRVDNVRKSWAGVLNAAKITGFRWHDMRHTFASWLVMRGVDLNTVRELLGHGDIKMTLRYAHLAPQHKADAVARLI